MRPLHPFQSGKEATTQQGDHNMNFTTKEATRLITATVKEWETLNPLARLYRADFMRDHGCIDEATHDFILNATPGAAMEALASTL